MIEQGDVDAVVVHALPEDLYDAVSVFAEVERRGYDHVHGDGRRGGLFRVFASLAPGTIQVLPRVLGDPELLRRAEGWLVWPVLFHPNLRRKPAS